MQEFINTTILAHQDFSLLAKLAIYGLAMIGYALILGLILIILGLAAWLLARRIMAISDGRPGVAGWGLRQMAADLVKLIGKHAPPDEIHEPLPFRLSVYFLLGGLFLSFLVLTVNEFLQPLKINIGLLYLIVCLLGAWNGLFLFGVAHPDAARSGPLMDQAFALLMLELVAIFSLIPVVMMSGSLALPDIIVAQGNAHGLFNWHIFHDPFAALAGVIFFLTVLLKFSLYPGSDAAASFFLPVASQEAGQVQPIRQNLLFFSRYLSVLLGACLMVTLFLGGWQVPGLEAEINPLRIQSIYISVVGSLFYIIKIFLVMSLVFWLHRILPALSRRAVMTQCLCSLLPWGIACCLGTACWLALFHGQSLAMIVYDIFRIS
jgi:NADH-quinone oxidoreductase subunit H